MKISRDESFVMDCTLTYKNIKTAEISLYEETGSIVKKQVKI